MFKNFFNFWGFTSCFCTDCVIPMLIHDFSGSVLLLRFSVGMCCTRGGYSQTDCNLRGASILNRAQDSQVGTYTPARYRSRCAGAATLGESQNEEARARRILQPLSERHQQKTSATAIEQTVSRYVKSTDRGKSPTL